MDGAIVFFFLIEVSFKVAKLYQIAQPYTSQPMLLCLLF
uniref:Uncharacterized protein n=1 Tax=Anguilla anguilla TaxID=7936 RepID=A0A0E9PT33_ANGAN